MILATLRCNFQRDSTYIELKVNVETQAFLTSLFILFHSYWLSIDICTYRAQLWNPPNLYLTFHEIIVYSRKYRILYHKLLVFLLNLTSSVSACSSSQWCSSNIPLQATRYGYKVAFKETIIKIHWYMGPFLISVGNNNSWIYGSTYVFLPIKSHDSPFTSYPNNRSSIYRLLTLRNYIHSNWLTQVDKLLQNLYKEQFQTRWSSSLVMERHIARYQRLGFVPFTGSDLVHQPLDFLCQTRICCSPFCYLPDYHASVRLFVMTTLLDY